MTTANSTLPLIGMRVVELTEGPVGSIGRTLAEWGAQVVKVEPPGGGAERLEKTRVSDFGVRFATTNAGKFSVTLNLDESDDWAAFEILVQSADALIDGAGLMSGSKTQIDIDRLRALNPGLVILKISGFGDNNSFSSWQVTEPVLQAMCGELSRSGLPERDPLLPPGELATQCAASQGLLMLLAARYVSTTRGRGDHIDLSLLDGASAALDPGYGSSGTAAQGIPADKLPKGRPEARFRYPIIACADGYVRICILAPRQWQAMFEWLGRPEEFADPAFNTLRARYKSPTLIPCIAKLFAKHTGRELEAEAQHRGIPLSSVVALEEALASRQFLDRKAFAEVKISASTKIMMPNGIVEFDGRRAGIAGPPPQLGKNQEIVDNGWPARVRWEQAPQSADLGERPLAGLRVLDLGVIVVGAETGRLLADLGADVVKVESSQFPDGSRQSLGEAITVSFAVGHRNQRSFGLNLRSDMGRSIFLGLAANADVILSNFKPGTMASLGLDSETLLAHNPRLIMVDSSAFGPTGPDSKRMGYGPLVRAAAGLSLQWRYPDDPTSFSDALTVYPDHVCGRVGAAGVLALLLRRLETNYGGTLSIAQAEVMLSHMSAEIVAISATKSGHAMSTSEPPDYPWGVFPTAGEDQWCVISVRNDSDWQALCAVIDRKDLVGSPLLQASEDRLTAKPTINTAVLQWLATKTPDEAANLLQAAGVPAGPMLRVADMPLHKYFQERGFLKLVRHPLIEEPFHVEDMLAEAESLPRPAQTPAPLQGQHTEEIAREWLNLDKGSIQSLIAQGILETAPKVEAV